MKPSSTCIWGWSARLNGNPYRRLLGETCTRVSPDEPSRFYPALFDKAAHAIAEATDEFCDRAEATFEDIEAYGKEPTLDESWLAEVTGDRDSFYFSSDNLLVPPVP